MRRHGPENPFYLIGRRESALIVASEKSALQLADPIPADRGRHGWIVIQTTFETELLEVRSIEGGEARRKSAQGDDKPELSSDDSCDEAETKLEHERELLFRLTLNVGKWGTRGQQRRDHVPAAVAGEYEIAGFVGPVEGSPGTSGTNARMLHPRIDDMGEVQEHARAETVQAAFFHQVQTKLTKGE